MHKPNSITISDHTYIYIHILYTTHKTFSDFDIVNDNSFISQCLQAGYLNYICLFFCFVYKINYLSQVGSVGHIGQIADGTDRELGARHLFGRRLHLLH